MVLVKFAVAAAVVTGLGLLSACGGQSAATAPMPPATSPGGAASATVHHPRATAAAAGHHGRHHGGTVHGLLAIHDPGQVTGTLTGPCQTRDDGLLPDRSCTPGAIDPAVTQANIGSTICRARYTETVRPPEGQTEAFKWNIAEPAYGQHDVSGELDHLIPLELGGDNDARNLWVEAGPIPNPKDAVENALNQAVCHGRSRCAPPSARSPATGSRWRPPWHQHPKPEGGTGHRRRRALHRDGLLQLLLRRLGHLRPLQPARQPGHGQQRRLLPQLAYRRQRVRRRLPARPLRRPDHRRHRRLSALQHHRTLDGTRRMGRRAARSERDRQPRGEMPADLAFLV